MISNFIDHSKTRREDGISAGHGLDKRSGENKGNDDDLQDELVGCRCYLAHAMLLQGQIVAAEQVYRQILETINVTKRDYIVASRNGLAKCILAQRKPLEAKEILEDFIRAETISKGCRHTGDDIGACITTLGDIHMKLSNHTEARDCYQRAVDAVPETPSIHYNWTRFCLATAFFTLREFDKACPIFHDVYKCAIEGGKYSRTQMFEAECWLSWCLCEVGKFDEAEGHLRPVFSIMSAAADGPPAAIEDFYLGKGHFYKGRSALHRHNITGAIEHLRLGLGKLGRLRGPDDPTYLECQYYLGWSFVSQKNQSEASRIFEDLQKSNVSVEPVRPFDLSLPLTGLVR